MLIEERPHEATPLEMLSTGARLPNPLREPDPSAAEQQSQNVISSLSELLAWSAVVALLRRPQLPGLPATMCQCTQGRGSAR